MHIDLSLFLPGPSGDASGAECAIPPAGAVASDDFLSCLVAALTVAPGTSELPAVQPPPGASDHDSAEPDATYFPAHPIFLGLAAMPFVPAPADSPDTVPLNLPALPLAQEPPVAHRPVAAGSVPETATAPAPPTPASNVPPPAPPTPASNVPPPAPVVPPSATPSEPALLPSGLTTTPIPQPSAIAPGVSERARPAVPDAAPPDRTIPFALHRSVEPLAGSPGPLAASALAWTAKVVHAEVVSEAAPNERERGPSTDTERAREPVLRFADAPAPRAETPREATPPARQVADAILRHRAALDAGERTTVTLRLDPPELGTVRVSVTATEHGVSARLVAESEATRQLLESQLPLLRQRLQDAGVAVATCDVASGGAHPDGRHRPPALTPPPEAPPRPGRPAPRPPAAPTRSTGAIDVIA